MDLAQNQSYGKLAVFIGIDSHELQNGASMR